MSKKTAELVCKESAIKAIDLQILQKILPKFHGSRQKQSPRPTLFMFGETPTEGDHRAFLAVPIEDIENARFSRSARKIERMLRVLGDLVVKEEYVKNKGAEDAADY